MLNKRTKVLLGIGNAMLICMICISNVSAQVTPDDDLFWSQGNFVQYKFDFTEHYGKDDDYYNITDQVEISADVRYEITSLIGNEANITEAITNIKIKYNHNDTLNPFVAIYNQTSNMTEFLDDFKRETHAGNDAGSTMEIAINQEQNISITNKTLFTGVPDIYNNYTYNLNLKNFTENGEIINRFLVSSNLTGTIIDDNKTIEKCVKHGIFYTPMTFLEQNGTFWLDLNVNMSHITNHGLWAPDFSMKYDENETYTLATDDVTTQTEDAFRWRVKFELGYPKVGTYERSYYDMETGLLVEYYTEQTTWSGYWLDEYYANVKPHSLYFKLTGLSFTLSGNATPEIPGYPLVVFLVALGIGFALVFKRMSKKSKK